MGHSVNPKAPIKGGLGTFVFTGDDAGPIEVALQFEYTPKGGPIGNLLGKVLDNEFIKSFHGVPQQSGSHSHATLNYMTTQSRDVAGEPSDVFESTC